MIKHIMLTLLSHPERTPDWALLAADALAVHLDAELCAAMATITLPDPSTPLARGLVGSDAAVAAENQRSAAAADALAARFETVIGSSDPHRLVRIGCYNIVDPDPVARHARLFDLVALPIYGHPDENRLIQGLLFDSGRPLLLLPKQFEMRWRRVVIAWDGSRAAARALADAMPLCARAESVEVVTIVGKKLLPQDLALREVLHHLQCHHIEATKTYLKSQADDAGQELLAHVKARSAELLIMGGFGHSRMREFVLGGVTKAVIDEPPCPVLMSH